MTSTYVLCSVLSTWIISTPVFSNLPYLIHFQSLWGYKVRSLLPALPISSLYQGPFYCTWVNTVASCFPASLSFLTPIASCPRAPIQVKPIQWSFQTISQIISLICSNTLPFYLSYKWKPFNYLQSPPSSGTMTHFLLAFSHIRVASVALVLFL